MRRATAPIEPPAALHITLAERLRMTAARLNAMPTELATSLSLTADREGLDDEALRELGRAAGELFGLEATVEATPDAVTVSFGRFEARA